MTARRHRLLVELLRLGKMLLDGVDAVQYTLGTKPVEGKRGPPNPDLYPENNPVLRPPVAVPGIAMPTQNAPKTA